jgi:hypothetical protein
VSPESFGRASLSLLSHLLNILTGDVRSAKGDLRVICDQKVAQVGYY